MTQTNQTRASFMIISIAFFMTPMRLGFDNYFSSGGALSVTVIIETRVHNLKEAIYVSLITNDLGFI